MRFESEKGHDPGAGVGGETRDFLPQRRGGKTEAAYRDFLAAGPGMGILARGRVIIEAAE